MAESYPCIIRPQTTICPIRQTRTFSCHASTIYSPTVHFLNVFKCLQIFYNAGYPQSKLPSRLLRYTSASLFFHPSVDLTDSSYTPSDQSLFSTTTLTTESTTRLTDDEPSMSTSPWTNPFTTSPSHQSFTSSSPTDTDASSTSSSISTVSYPT